MREKYRVMCVYGGLTFPNLTGSFNSVFILNFLCIIFDLRV